MKQNKPNKQPKKFNLLSNKSFWINLIITIIVVIFVIRISRRIYDNLKVKVAYAELKTQLGAKNVALGYDKFDDSLKKYLEKQLIKSELTVTHLSIRETAAGNLHIDFRYQKNGKQIRATVYERIDRVQASEIRHIVEYYNSTDKKILYSNVLESSFNIFSFILSALPFVISGLFLYLIYKSYQSMNQQNLDIVNSDVKTAKTDVTFQDVAGLDEEKYELQEIVDFLKDPAKYTKVGARVPKGVLLVGPPGTGKTLMAKAVAGEANVSFISLSGSEFVEMFVGVGAKRVRNLFDTAKSIAPCIIFIDEIDAVGRQRGSGIGGGHDEREQTLNQILVEMDGFSTNSGIIVLAATNRSDVLDPALLRPGRFDRQIMVSLPDLKGRTKILGVHSRNKNLAAEVNLEDLARRIPGFSGADIENLMNEAALLAARANRVEITIADLDEGVDRVMMGPAKVSRKYSETEKKIVSYHEAGHAVIGLLLESANEVQKVTIIPRGEAGGYNLMMPKEESFFQTKEQLTESITGFLGGRVAEEIKFASVTNGAHNDFEKATQIARAMVTQYGMSELGFVQYEKAGSQVFLGRDYFSEKNFSDTVAHEIDLEIRKLMNECHEKAKSLILANLPLLEAIAYYLREVETLTREDIHEIHETGRLERVDLQKGETPDFAKLAKENSVKPKKTVAKKTNTESEAK